MELRSSILRELQARGFIYQHANLEELAMNSLHPPATAYVGFDCTAPSLHVGNLISIMMLRWWQKMEHRPIVLLGGATTRIGDPSGKEETRKLLDENQIEKNIQCIKRCFQQFLHFDKTSNNALLVNNREWLDDLNYIDFLREYGRHFSVNRMLGFDSVKTRLEREQNLSFLEFNYMIFQAYDFLQLYRRHDCILQMGGADQWGNILNGIELAHKVDYKHLSGLTCPLITTANGQKMGKTASGAVWLDASMTSSWDYWQYWRDVDDKDIGRFLRLFTELPLEEIARLEALQGSEINDAKIILANEVTKMLHGEEALSGIHAGVKEGFDGDLDKESTAIPSVEISHEDLVLQYGLLAALVKAGLATSNNEARNFVRDGAVRVNGEYIKNEKHRLTLGDLTPNRTILLSVGKKKFVRLREVK